MALQTTVMGAAHAEFQRVDVNALTFSKSSAQAERRKHFDQVSLAELVENIKTNGVVQPIVVRPNGKPDHFEVVAGERRVLAARKAGHELIPAMVCNLTEDQALDVQLIENLQREGLHELVECEGYEDLRKRGHSVDQIAEKVGKSSSYVYKRLELAACSTDVRKAFYAGKLDASRALLLSRLKPDELQKKALAEITDEDRWTGAMSYRQALEHVRRNYMLRIDQAPFKTEDATLVPAAGACGACPKNTAKQAGLFGDVSKEALCTDSGCFKSKIAAAAALIVTEARKSGQTVIEGKAAAKALSFGGEFVKLEDRCYDDSKNRTYKQLLGKDAVVTVAVDPGDGKAVEVIKKDDAKKIMKTRGVKLRSSSSTSSAPKRSAKEIEAEKAREAKEKAEDDLLLALSRAVYAKPPKPFTLDELQKIADAMLENQYGDAVDKIIGESAFAVKTGKLNEAGLMRLIRAAVMAQHVEDGDKGVVSETAKRAGVNVEKIKLELAAPKLAKVLDAPKAKAAKKK